MFASYSHLDRSLKLKKTFTLLNGAFFPLFGSYLGEKTFFLQFLQIRISDIAESQKQMT